jgi:hypothetical protein
MTCTRCGAFQATDSDPAFDRLRLADLAARLFNAAGWRSGVNNTTLCPECANSAA